jgi:hypothetical protein
MTASQVCHECGLFVGDYGTCVTQGCRGGDTPLPYTPPYVLIVSYREEGRTFTDTHGVNRIVSNGREIGFCLPDPRTGVDDPDEYIGYDLDGTCSITLVPAGD